MCGTGPPRSRICRGWVPSSLAGPARRRSLDGGLGLGNGLLGIDGWRALAALSPTIPVIIADIVGLNRRRSGPSATTPTLWPIIGNDVVRRETRGRPPHPSAVSEARRHPKARARSAHGRTGRDSRRPDATVAYRFSATRGASRVNTHHPRANTTGMMARAMSGIGGPPATSFADGSWLGSMKA